VQRGTRIDEIAPSIATNGNIIAAKIDGRPVDLSRRLDSDCSLAWVSIDSPDGLDVLRHSTAHLMAQAVQSLFPGTQVTIGPTIEDGFYYDFKRDRGFTPEEIEKIEARMEEIAKSNLKVTREEMPKVGPSSCSAAWARTKGRDHRRYTRRERRCTAKGTGWTFAAVHMCRPPE
jgi:threonyl-tRNA synthetase